MTRETARGTDDGADRRLPSTRPPVRHATLPPPSVDDADRIRTDLLKNAASYDFFYAVGMMERLDPMAVRVGGDGPYDKESIRFRHDPSLAFKSGDMTSVSWGPKPRSPERALEATEHRFEVSTAFIGLTGTISPLPLYMAEEIAQAQDTAQVRRDFLDLFHHRIISFVYRIGVKHDLAREYLKDATDPWSRRILALAGFDAWSTRKLKHIPQWRLLRLAPLLAGGTRSARTIELALEDICGEALDGASIRVEQFAGGWSPLDTDQRMALGARNHELGLASILGAQCYDKAGRAVLAIGPLGDNFRRFLADGDMYPVVVEVLELLSRDPIEFAMRLEVSEQSRPPFCLGESGGGRVGVDTWLASEQGGTGVTNIDVSLPMELPQDSEEFNYGWQSRPQRM